jgi:AAA+ ATPase superfamily predicted ATPase
MMFEYGKPVHGKNFFDRTEMKKKIKSFIENGADFMIKAPRRYGKTSLIVEMLGDRPYIYLDFRRVPRLSLIPEQLIDQGYEMLGIKGFFVKAKSNALSLVKEVRLSAKANIDIVEFGAEAILEADEKRGDCERLIDALSIVDEIGKSLGQKIVIVYDEFQDIKKLDCGDSDILEVLRGTLQHKEYLHSIFLGSIESIMTDIFENKKSPFFNYCRKVSLEPFDLKELNKELQRAFKEKKMIFEHSKDLEDIILRLRGHPANTMLTMQSLYYLMLEKGQELIKTKDVHKAFERAYYEQLDLVTQYISEMKSKKHYHDVMYRMAREEEQILTSQALFQVRKGLVNIGFLIQKDKDNYMIVDSFLEEYLRR